MNTVLAFVLCFCSFAFADQIIKLSGHTIFSPSLSYFVRLQIDGSEGKLQILNKEQKEISISKAFNINGALIGLNLTWNEDESMFFASFPVGRGGYKNLIIETQTGEILNCSNPRKFYDCYSDYKPHDTTFISKNIISNFKKGSKLEDNNKLIITNLMGNKIKYDFIDLPETVKHMQFLGNDLFLFRTETFQRPIPIEKVFIVDRMKSRSICSVNLDSGHTQVTASANKNYFALISPLNLDVSFYDLNCRKLFTKKLDQKLFADQNPQASVNPDGQLFLFEKGNNYIQIINPEKQTSSVEVFSNGIFGIKWNSKGEKLILFGEYNIVGSLLLKATSFKNGLISNSSYFNGSVVSPFEKSELNTWGPKANDSFYLLRSFDVDSDEIHIYSW